MCLTTHHKINTAATSIDLVLHVAVLESLTEEVPGLRFLAKSRSSIDY